MTDRSYVTTNRFLVVVHDVAPVFADQLGIIVGELSPLLGDRFSAAVVPHWHGGPSGAADDKYLELLGCFGEHLLHGWTHQREDGRSLISLLTDQADEFLGLDAAAIRARVGLAQAAFVGLTGKPACGLIPPAWQLPIRSTQLDDVRFVMRFHRLESCVHSGHAQRLTTWSWDWGSPGNLLVPGGEWIAHFLKWKDPESIPCIAIHPADVGRGWFQRSLRMIRHFLDRNYEPAVGSELLRKEGADR